MKLLTTDNFKLCKKIRNFKIAGLTLAPHKLSGYGVCPASTAACRAVCVMWFKGFNVMKKTRQAMINRTRFYVEHPGDFKDQLSHEIDRFIIHCHKQDRRPVIRLNVASDLDWSDFVEQFKCMFYDYTKRPDLFEKYLEGDFPRNYHLTFSRSERKDDIAEDYLRRGGNVSIVFSTAYDPRHGVINRLPPLWMGHRVIDGDKHDLRIPAVDGRGVVVGLRFKGSLRRKAIAIRQGFCIDG